MYIEGTRNLVTLEIIIDALITRFTRHKQNTSSFVKNYQSFLNIIIIIITNNLFIVYQSPEFCHRPLYNRYYFLSIVV